MISCFQPKDYQQCCPGRVEQRPKLSSTNNLTESNLTLLCLNVRSLNKHLDDLKALIYSLQCPPPNLCLTEIWLLKNDNDKNLAAGFKQLEASIRVQRSGGAMIQVRESCNILKIYHSPFKERAFVLLSFSGFRIIVLGIYSAPANNEKEFLEISDSFLEQILAERAPIIYCGEVNIVILANSLLKSEYLKVIEGTDFKILSNEPTRITQVSKTCIDHVITQNIKCIVNALEQHSFFDRETLLITGNVKEKASNVTYYRNCSFLKNTRVFVRFLQIITNEFAAAQNCFENIDDMNMAFDCFREKFLKVTHSFAPYRESSRKTSKLPKWFNNQAGFL